MGGRDKTGSPWIQPEKCQEEASPGDWEHLESSGMKESMESPRQDMSDPGCFSSGESTDRDRGHSHYEENCHVHLLWSLPSRTQPPALPLISTPPALSLGSSQARDLTQFSQGRSVMHPASLTFSPLFPNPRPFASEDCRRVAYRSLAPLRSHNLHLPGASLKTLIQPPRCPHFSSQQAALLLSLQVPKASFANLSIFRVSPPSTPLPSGQSTGTLSISLPSNLCLSHLPFFPPN